MSRIASLDLRNVVKTVASLPQTYTRKPVIVINDASFDVVARSVIILLLIITVADEQKAVETVLHVWYSAFLRPADLERVQSLRPLIEDVCSKIAGRNPESLQAKTFKIGSCSIRVVLKKEHWTSLLEFLDVPDGLTTSRARSIRLAVIQAPDRLDFHERDLTLQQPEHRICKGRFREDGILLPFGQTRENHTIPNPYVTRLTANDKRYS